MKKLVLLSGIILLGAVAGASNFSAYGGGGGFPPGYFDNPHARPGLECEMVTMELPNGKSVTVPKCHVVRSEEERSDFIQRINDFIERVKNGGR